MSNILNRHDLIFKLSSTYGNNLSNLMGHLLELDNDKVRLSNYENLSDDLKETFCNGVLKDDQICELFNPIIYNKLKNYFFINSDKDDVKIYKEFDETLLKKYDNNIYKSEYITTIEELIISLLYFNHDDFTVERLDNMSDIKKIDFARKIIDSFENNSLFTIINPLLLNKFDNYIYNVKNFKKLINNQISTLIDDISDDFVKNIYYLDFYSFNDGKDIGDSKDDRMKQLKEFYSIELLGKESMTELYQTEVINSILYNIQDKHMQYASTRELMLYFDKNNPNIVPKETHFYTKLNDKITKLEELINKREKYKSRNDISR